MTTQAQSKNCTEKYRLAATVGKGGSESVTALEEFLRRRRSREFQRRMNEMGSDPEIRKASKSISQAFNAANMDGLE